VDHGKSALVQALTGTHPDRLKEEQAREMTIDLGFAWLTLPQSEEVGIVDVPGHRDFIENMLAGVGGIDAALFVVAADEGVMPQTREHLDILDILQIPAGVVALTKTDLIDDPEWLDLVEMDVRTAVSGTVLEDAPFVRVSARSGEGMDELLQALSGVLEKNPPRADLGRPRLPVDRVFTISGFGTVVTGTLIDGSLSVGDEVEVLPGGTRGRVRGLQSHKRKEDRALPGSRTAVNISGVEVEQIRRGDVIALPGRYRPTQRLDVRFKLLPGVSGPIRHSQEVKLFLGAAEVLARVRLLGVEELSPGQEGWLQLELKEAVVAVRSDRYILRRPSPGETLGGGVVVDPQPGRRHKRFDDKLIGRLETLQQGTPADIVLQAALALGLSALRQVSARARLADDQIETAVQELVEEGRLIAFEPGQLKPQADLLVMAEPAWLALQQRAQQEAQNYHSTNPLRGGMPREELKSRLRIEGSRPFNAILKMLIRQDVLEEHGTLVSLPGHTIRFTPEQQAKIDRSLAAFAAQPYSPPTVKEVQAEVGEAVFSAMVELGLLVQVSADVVYREEDYQALRAWVTAHFEQEADLTVAQFRDAFQTSRRYALGFLEHLDACGVTIRTGDARQLRRGR
jgi:selenocysteine-specific elongation factor